MAIIWKGFFWHPRIEWMLYEEQKACFALCSYIADHRASGPVDSGCNGGESWWESLDVNNTGTAGTTESSTAPEDMKPRDPGRVELSGGQVET